MTIAIYPGTFDPIHNGHIDIATRAALVFEKLVLAVYARPMKNVLFTAEERTQLASQALAHLGNVQVCQYADLTVDLAKRQQALVLVRGLRMSSDFDLEYQMALANKALDPDVETCCLLTNLNYVFLSSSIVKEIALAGGDVSDMVPEHVRQALEHKYAG